MSFDEVGYRTRIAETAWRWIWWCRSMVAAERYCARAWRQPLIQVRPEEIVHRSLREFRVRRYEGAILGGDWDALGHPFEELDVHRAFADRMRRGLEWSQTAFYRRVVAQIARGEEKWECRTREEFDARCRRLDRLIEEIAREGYRLNPAEPSDAITVNIGRRGDLLFNEGRHRLSICKLLGIPSIPVRVTVRHAEWATFVDAVLAQLRAGAGRAPFRLSHPDLEFVPFRFGERRAALIRDHLPARAGTLVDVRSSWGALALSFERIGFHCHCVEETERDASFAERLKQASGGRFRVWSGGVRGYAREHGECDAVVSVGGWDDPREADAGAQVRAWVEVVETLRAREAFLEAPLASDALRSAVRALGAGTLQDLTVKRSRFSRSDLIGVTEEGTSIHRFS